MPDKTDILVHGVAEDDQLLKELIQDSRNHCFVVYPSEDAVPLTALFPATGPTGATGATGESSAQVAEIVPVAVLIDGTWNQAQRMHKHFEAMQHVVVFPTGPVEFRIPRWLETNRTTALLVLCTGNLETQKKLYPDIFIFFNHCFVLSLFDVIRHSGQSKFHWRRQSQEGRISTVEAAALVLEELGQSGDGDALRNALAILMDALGRQCHHDSWRLKKVRLGLMMFGEAYKSCLTLHCSRSLSMNWMDLDQSLELGLK